MLVGRTVGLGFQIPYIDQKKNCSRPEVNMSFCYDGPIILKNLYKSCAVHGSMAITFDDGPSENTDDILDVLRAANMKATFFLIGRKLKMFPDAVRRIAAEGHQIGAHTFNHVKLVNMTSEDVRKEMTMFEDALGNFGISMLKYMRPPWGVLDDVSYAVIQEMGYTAVHWGSLSGDSYVSDAEDVMTVYYSHLGGPNGDGVIAKNLTLITQQHDRRNVTADSFVALSSYLTKTFGSQGVQFLTIDQCLYGVNNRTTTPSLASSAQGINASLYGIIIAFFIIMFSS